MISDNFVRAFAGEVECCGVGQEISGFFAKLKIKEGQGSVSLHLYNKDFLQGVTHFLWEPESHIGTFQYLFQVQGPPQRDSQYLVYKVKEYVDIHAQNLQQVSIVHDSLRVILEGCETSLERSNNTQRSIDGGLQEVIPEVRLSISTSDGSAKNLATCLGCVVQVESLEISGNFLLKDFRQKLCDKKSVWVMKFEGAND